jgi:hypothetical protein
MASAGSWSLHLTSFYRALHEKVHSWQLLDLFEELAKIVPFELKAFLLEAYGKLDAGNGVIAGKHLPIAGFEILLFSWLKRGMERKDWEGLELFNQF